MKNNRIDAPLAAALKDWHKMNTDRQWAKLYCTGYVVLIDYGTIHTNGDREKAMNTLILPLGP
jgi:hypothetical protein